jgi:hypothetical protein
MNCIHCKKPIRQATQSELNGAGGAGSENNPPNKWYKHTTNMWHCYGYMNGRATAPVGTKWAGKLPEGATMQYKAIVKIKKAKPRGLHCGTCGIKIKAIRPTRLGYSSEYYYFTHVIKSYHGESTTREYCQLARSVYKYYHNDEKLPFCATTDHISGRLFLAHPEKGFIGRIYTSKKHMRRRKGYVKGTKEVKLGNAVNLLGRNHRKFKELA